MIAKNGELAIAKWYPIDKGKTHEECVCFVTGRNKSRTKFVYWDNKGNGTIMSSGELPKSRVVSAVPKPGKEFIFFCGEFCKLTIDDVEPKTTDNMIEETSSTSNVKLGGCYHTGKAYCLGYRNGHGEEIELDDRLFVGLNGGIEGGAKTALMRHPEEFPQRDVPRFIVELMAVGIIDENTEDKKEGEDTTMPCDSNDYRNENCSGGYSDESFCCDCGELQEECACEDACDYDDDGYCIGCQEICDDCECLNTYKFDDENVDKTFRPMNAFDRARWLKTRRSQ